MTDYVYDDEGGKHPPRPSWLPTEGPGNMNVTPVKWGMKITQFCAFITWCKLMGPWDELTDEENNFGKTKGYVNLYQICDRYVKPYTRGLGSSIALLLNNEAPLLAEIMISHAWGEGILETMAALLGKASTLSISLETAIWFCTFAQYQPGDLPGDCGPGVAAQLALDPFKQVIESKPRYGMLVIHTSRVELYTRLWCVFEVNEAEASGVVASAAASMLYLLKLAGGKAMKDLEGEDVELDKSVRSENLQCDSQNAGCWSKEDALMIKKKVEAQGGFGKLDDKIFEFRKATTARMWDSMKKVSDWARSSDEPGLKKLSENQMFNVFQECILAAANYVGLSCLIRLWLEAGMADEEGRPIILAGPELLGKIEGIMLTFDRTKSNPPPGLDKDKYVFKGDQDAWQAETEKGQLAFLDIADLQKYPLALGLLEMSQGGNTLGSLVSTLKIGSTIKATLLLNKMADLFDFERRCNKKLERVVQTQILEAAKQGLDTSELPDPTVYWRTPDGKTYNEDTLDDLVMEMQRLCEEAGVTCDKEAEKATEHLKPITYTIEWRVASYGGADNMDESSRAKIKDIFNKWDEDKSGAISKPELAAFFKNLDPSFTDHDVDVMISVADVNKDGQIDYNEFLDWLFGASGGLGKGQGDVCAQLSFNR